MKRVALALLLAACTTEAPYTQPSPDAGALTFDSCHLIQGDTLTCTQCSDHDGFFCFDNELVVPCLPECSERGAIAAMHRLNSIAYQGAYACLVSP